MRKIVKKRYSEILLISLLLLLFSGIAYAEDGTQNHKDNCITLSPEQLSEHYKDLKGYRVHTVVWLDSEFWGDLFAQERENSDEYKYQLTSFLSKSDCDTDEYIEINATVDNDFLGTLWLADVEIISTGDDAKKILETIDASESSTETDINTLKAEIDRKKQEEVEQAEREEEESFYEMIRTSYSEFEASDDIISLTPKQLDERSKELDGKQFHSVFTVEDVDDDELESTCEEGEWSESFSFEFDWDYDLRKYIHEGDIVEIVGQIESGFFGGIDYVSCRIISIGDDAKAALNEIVCNETEKQKETDDSSGSEVETIQSVDETDSLSQGEQNNPEAASFNSLLDILTVSGHPILYDSEKAAQTFYQNAPEGTVSITTWDQSLTEYFDHEPEYKVLWLDGNPLDLGKDASTIGFVTINFSSLEQEVDIDTAIEIADSFIPSDIYRQNGRKEKYISTDESVVSERRTCWVIYYDTLVEGIDRYDLAVMIYGDSEGNVRKSINSFSQNITPGEKYTLVDWNVSEEGAVEQQAVVADESNEPVPEADIFSSIVKGNSGEAVVEIQNQLAVLGYLTSSVDGKFGPGTEQAVKDFQNANQLEPTGTVDKETYDMLFTSEPKPEEKPAEPEPIYPIKRGDSGDQVVEIQKRLIELGYLTSSADGKFGPGTEQAVQSFQDANYMDATGVVDESTYNKLFSAGAKHYVAPFLTSDVEEKTSDAGTRNYSDPLVWIPNSGSKYHSNSGCSGMKNPHQVSRSQAEARGYEPCKKCY